MFRAGRGVAVATAALIILTGCAQSSSATDEAATGSGAQVSVDSSIATCVALSSLLTVLVGAAELHSSGQVSRVELDVAAHLSHAGFRTLKFESAELDLGLKAEIEQLVVATSSASELDQATAFDPDAAEFVEARMGATEACADLGSPIVITSVVPGG